jgi:hypothetical protein
MILFISNPGEDYHDSIFYAFKKTFGDGVVTYPGKPNYYERYSDTGNHFRNCHYDFTDAGCTESDVCASAANGTLRAIFIISSGYRVWPDWEQLRSKLASYPKTYPVIIIDGADGDRIQYSPDDWDLYFAREFHMGSVRHELTHYPKFQVDALLATGKPPKGVLPLPFCVIPEKFAPMLKLDANGKPYPFMNYQRDVFFRGAYGKQRAKYLEGVHIPNSFIDINYHAPIHTQDRLEFFNLIQSSKININITAGGNDCMRFWELLGAGGFVLTETHDQVIMPPYENDIHLDRFSTKEEMLDKIQFYLKHENIRERIRRQGYEFTMKNHTCYSRMEYIIKAAKARGWEIA